MSRVRDAAVVRGPAFAERSAQKRDQSLDGLRVVGVLAGIGLHAAIPYMTEPPPSLLWAVHDPARHPFANLVFWWGRCAQPALFFVLAGVLAVHMSASRSPRQYLLARVERVGGAFIAGTLLLLPILAAVCAWGWVSMERASWAEALTWRFADSGIQQNRFGPAHLWFLEDLLILSAAFALAPRRWIDAAIRIRSKATALVIVAAAGTAILLLDLDAVFDLRNTFVPSVSRLLYGATFFAGGVRLAHDRERSSRWLPAAVLLGCAALAAAVIARFATEGVRSDVGRFVLALAATGCAWLSILAWFRIAHHPTFRLPRPGQHLAAVSLPVYVIHLPIVCGLQILLFTVPINAGLKFACVFAGALALSWAGGGMLVSTERGLDRLALVPARIWMIAAIAAGIALRVAQYARNPDVWHDEAALLVNIVERTYMQLLEPLTYHEAAPPLFLWAQRLIVETVSDELWAMRIVPLVASVSTLLLLVPATRVLRDGTAPIAVLLVACSPRLVWHSVEAKPYAVDVAVAAAILSACVVTRHWPTRRRVGLFVAATPAIVWASYPGIFLVAGIALSLLTTAVIERQRASLAGFAAVAVVAVVSVVPLLAGPISAQRDATIYAAWVGAFPTAWDPLTLAAWLTRGVIGVVDYCFRPLGGMLVVPIAFGIASLRQRGGSALVVAMVGPLAVAALAGMTNQYPFTGARVMIWALPALALLAAEGIGDMIRRLPRRTSVAAALVISMAVLPSFALNLRDVITAWSRPETFAAAQMARAARGPDGVTTSGAWEYRYYLRHPAVNFVPLGERALPDARRVWWLVHGATTHERRAAAATARAAGYEVVSVTDFRGVSVVELKSKR